MKGQALLTLLIFVVVATTVITASTLILIINNQSVTKVERSQQAFVIAESGVENALLRLLRNPAYVGETVTIGEGTAEVTVTGSGTQTITSVGTVDGYVWTIEVGVDTSGGVATVTSWEEIY